MKRTLWTLSVVSSILGAIIFLVGVITGGSELDIVNFSAIGIAFAVIPYCLAQAVSERNACSKEETAD